MARRLWDSRLSTFAWSVGANAKGWHDRWRRVRRRLFKWQEANPPPVPPKAPARGWPYHGRRPRRLAQPGGRKRRRRGESGGQGCPERTSGDVVRPIPSPTKGWHTPKPDPIPANVRRRGAVNPEPGKAQAHLENGPSHKANVRRRGAVNPELGKGQVPPETTDQAAARITKTTAAASYSPSPDRGDRTETLCHNVTPPKSLPRPHRLHSRVARHSDSKTLIATAHFSEAATVASAPPAACFLASAA